MPPRPTLAVLVDGKPLPDADARVLWERFSAHLDAHQNDFDGFAKANGWAQVKPEYRRGQAVLVVATGSRTP